MVAELKELMEESESVHTLLIARKGPKNAEEGLNAIRENKGGAGFSAPRAFDFSIRPAMAGRRSR